MPESDFEQNLYQLRRDKLKQIEALGQQAYPNSYTFTHTIPELRAFDTPENTLEELANRHIEASIAGRIMAIRAQGKAGFAQVSASRSMSARMMWARRPSPSISSSISATILECADI